MREILYRGKRADNGEWVEGFYLYTEENTHPVIIDMKCRSHIIIPETVGQFTGLTDKNGVRVFEDDILFSSYIADSPSIEVVKWIYNGWHTQEGDLTPDMIDDVGIMPYSEVIGNVHDNRLEAFYGRYRISKRTHCERRNEGENFKS